MRFQAQNDSVAMLKATIERVQSKRIEEGFRKLQGYKMLRGRQDSALLKVFQ